MTDTWPRAACLTFDGNDPDLPPAVEAATRHRLDLCPVRWDDPAADWSQYQVAIVRSTWDYARQRHALLEAGAQYHLIRAQYRRAERPSRMPIDPIEDEMARGRFAGVRREGDTVVRHPAVKNSGSRALLRHFEDQGCRLTPRVLEASEQHERLSYIPGVTGYPPLTADLRSEEALVSVARAARTIHDLSASLTDPGAYEWHPLETCRPVHDTEIIGHGDLAPWNIVFEGTEVSGIIDWDAAGPMTRSWDMAYLAHQFVPFHLGDDISSWGWDRPPDRRARLALLCEAYGGLDPEDVVDDAVVRLYSTGMFLRRRIGAGDPRFEVQRRERHDRGFMAAAAKLAAHRDALLDLESK